MIKEDYVSFETAKLLKEKGFKNSSGIILGKSGRHYNKYETFPSKDMAIEASGDCEDKCPLVTLQMTMKWLREVHHIFIDIDYDTREFGDKPYFTLITNMNTCDYYKGKNLPLNNATYKGAAEAAIKYCLENLI